MSGLARILLDLGYQVSGSDLKPNQLTDQIESKGARLICGHHQQNVFGVEMVVYSSAIRPDNPELVMARSKGIPIVQRAEVLSELMSTKTGIAVTGSHGKTTTTSLAGSILLEAGLDPTIVVGGRAGNFGGNAVLGKGDYFVAEADESDGSFLLFHPAYSIITNIEEEHLDFYKDLDQIISTYRKFIDNTSPQGVLFWNKDDKNIESCLAGFKGRNISFGFSDSADLYADNVKMHGFKSSFDCHYNQKFLARLELNLPSDHNILNALAAVSLSRELGIDLDSISRALAGYHGVDRRFQIKLNNNGLMVIDDYAHHPTEVEATLKACRAGGKRIICVFQPHRYSRTKHLSKRFSRAFYSADHLILAEVYPADEEPINGITSKCIYDELKKNGWEKLSLAVNKEEALAMVQKLLKPDDLVLVMGAGDIGYVADELARMYAKQ